MLNPNKLQNCGAQAKLFPNVIKECDHIIFLSLPWQVGFTPLLCLCEHAFTPFNLYETSIARSNFVFCLANTNKANVFLVKADLFLVHPFSFLLHPLDGLL